MGSVDWNAAYFWLSLAQWIAVIAVAIYAHVKQRRQATKNEINEVSAAVDLKLAEMTRRVDDHRERLTSGDNRFTRIEEGLSRLPSGETIGQLQLQLERLSGDLRVTNQALRGVSEKQDSLGHQVGVIDEYLRNKS